jgi:hypothetical protein
MDDEHEGGRGFADVVGEERETAEADTEVLDVLVGRVGEPRQEPGAPVEILVGVGGVEVEVVFNAFNAARCGRGLMGRTSLSEEETVVGVLDLRLSTLSSSSEPLNRRRVPARTFTGEGGLAVSEVVDLGRYLGSDEVVMACVFARRAAALVVTPGLGRRPADSGLGGKSSGGALLFDTRLRVLPFDSGVAVLLVA